MFTTCTYHNFNVGTPKAIVTIILQKHKHVSAEMFCLVSLFEIVD